MEILPSEYQQIELSRNEKIFCAERNEQRAIRISAHQD